MTALVACPLCGAFSSSVVETFEVSRIVSEWMRQMKMDVTGEFHDLLQFELWRCGNCALQFFQPDSLVGSSLLYEGLGKLDWYYMQNKWEHDLALQDLDGCKNGIEVGCGFGDFVARVARGKGIPFEGYEQNPIAVQAARAKGVSVHLGQFEKLAVSQPSTYDVVCSFQVLEHVTRPKSFLDAACALLRPGGKLILGLPNAKSFLKHQFNLLDLPPHHMSRWTDETLTRLQKLFPLKLTRIAYEPLADYHVDEYVAAYASLLASRGFGVLAVPRLLSWMGRFIRVLGVRNALRGQTIYACYVRA
jgi:SAM-dependent methyltransferase